ncbi:MAG: thioredoxin family protein [Verrucomicrobiales bacterium]|nr:thioredoxin family protein [Verrucomicrobiales bacterium]
MNRIITLLLLTFACGLAQEKKPSDTAVELAWHTDESTAKKDAKSQRKPILLMFTADWCHFCQTMEKETLSKPKVSQYLNENFILLQIDYDTGKDLIARYRVTGVPAMVMGDPELKKVEKTSGFMPVDVFMAWAEMSAITVSTDAIAAEEKAAREFADELSARFRSGLFDDQYAAINEFFEDFNDEVPRAVEFAETRLPDEIKHNPGRFARFLKDEKLHVRILTTNTFAKIYGNEFSYDPWDLSQQNSTKLDAFLKQHDISPLLEELMDSPGPVLKDFP